MPTDHSRRGAVWLKVQYCFISLPQVSVAYDLIAKNPRSGDLLNHHERCSPWFGKLAKCDWQSSSTPQTAQVTVLMSCRDYGTVRTS